VKAADNDAKEEAKKEARKLHELTGGQKAELVFPIVFDEIARAKKLWELNNKKMPEMYDIDFVLTDTQSRIEALRRRGYNPILADPELTKAIVQAAKESTAQQRKSDQSSKAKAEADAQKKADAEREAETKAKKEEERAAAKKKAEAFMRKISVDKLDIKPAQ
jgi:colicin import membrane protein